MDNPRLAQILVDDAVISATVLENALQRQVILGGSLDTNLLELGAASETALTAALGRAGAGPTAGRAEIEAIAPHLPQLFPLVFAETYHLVPERLVGETLSVLIGMPLEPQLRTLVAERLHLQLAPIYCCEVRLHYAMHRLYGAELLPRYRTLLAKLDPVDAPPPKPEAPSERVLSWGVATSRIAAPRGADGRLTGRDVRSMVARLDAATDRDAIVEVLLGFALAAFDFAALFLVQGDYVHGWRGTDAAATQRIAQISVPLSHPSVFQTLYATGGHYLGPLPQNSANQQLLSALGRPPPRVACLAPILVGGRMAALLYADNGAHSVATKRVAALLILLHRAGLGLEQLIHRRKRAHAVAVPMAQQAGSADSLESLNLNLNQDLDSATAAPTSTPTPSYVAFADVQETPRASLDEWEDVLLDTVSESQRSATLEAAAVQGPSYAAQWQDVVQEAQRASQLVAPVSSNVLLGGQSVATQEILFDALAADDPEARQSAVAQLLPLGARMDAMLMERFPGHLRLDPLTCRTQPTFDQYSGVCELLAARGGDAAPLVISQLGSDLPQHRLIAVAFFQAVFYPLACEALARRLYDTEPKIRQMTVEALRGMAGEPAYGRLIAGLCEQLQGQVEAAQATALQILGQLREARMVPEIISCLAAENPNVMRTAALALAVICTQTFGANVPRWRQWWDAHGHQPRSSWLLAGLAHSSAAIRRVAHHELQVATGQSLPFNAEAPVAERSLAQQAWSQVVAHNAPAPAAPAGAI